MAVSTTTFAQRMQKINSGKTTSWTVPGQGLADLRDERNFLRKANIKVKPKSTQQRSKKNKRSLLACVFAAVVGAGSVIAARWIDFTYLDTAIAFAAEKGVDAGAILAMIGDVPTSLALAVVISLISMFVLGLGTRRTLPLMITGFVGALMFEPELVALAPEVYAQFYPPSWVANMVANASLT